MYVLFTLFVMIFFFFNDTATTEIYTLSLHDALPTSVPPMGARANSLAACCSKRVQRNRRSEEHTSELQSHVNLVCRLLLDKKNSTTRIYVGSNGETTYSE